MWIKQLWTDLKGSPLIHLTLLVFMAIPSALLALSFQLFLDLQSSLDYLFESARVPHFLQMHSGEVDQESLENWALDQTMVDQYQLLPMIPLNGSSLFLGEERISQGNTIMDIGLVTQSTAFDYLLDLNNRPLRMNQGQVAVPLYYREKLQLKLGDPLEIHWNGDIQTFEITAFLRDGQMNPAMVHSKRILFHRDDWAGLAERIPEREYLIEFRLSDPSLALDFQQLYQAAELPSQGPAITLGLLRLINGISQGITMVILFLVSLLFTTVALLALRFTIITSLENDLKQMGVMRAMGFSLGRLSRIYLKKYLILAGLALLLGYLLSLPLGAGFRRGILLYMGSPPATVWTDVIPLLSSLPLMAMIYWACRMALRRVAKVPPVQALRGETSSITKGSPGLQYHGGLQGNLGIFLSMKELGRRWRQYLLLALLYGFCAFILLLPLKFLQTLESPSFMGYLGFGDSQIRMDLRGGPGQEEQCNRLTTELAGHESLLNYGLFRAYSLQVQLDSGETKDLQVESGDYSHYAPLFLEGRAPMEAREIALSQLYADELQLSIDQRITVVCGGTQEEWRICGIYQDISNGGFSAKTAEHFSNGDFLWAVVYADLQDSTTENLLAFKEHMAETFPSMRISLTRDYLAQTLGPTLEKLRRFYGMAALGALSVSFMLSLLFLRMLHTRDRRELALKQGLGFSSGLLIRPYAVSLALSCLVGIGLGQWLSGGPGEALMGALWSSMGASEIHFHHSPGAVWLLIPGLLMGLTFLATYLGRWSHKNYNLAPLKGC